jgi:excisionase family DNA binding protein
MEAFIRQKGDHTETQPSGFLKIQEIANYLGIKVSTIYALVERRGIPHYRVGRLVRFKKPEVDQWMEGQRKPAVDVKVETRRVIGSLQKRSDLRIKRTIRKIIEEVKGGGYTVGNGKPDQDRDLRKEVEDGSL